jgi:glycosyltransferase 2 family protein
MKTIAVTAIKIVITTLLFVYVFRNNDFHEFGLILSNASIVILIASFAVLWLGHYICIFRWRMLMRPLMPVLSLGSLFSIYCIGLFFNLAFPTLIGGDVVKMYYAGKPSKCFSQSFAATFLDRDAGMFAMMIIACIATVIYPMAVPGIPLSLVGWRIPISFIIWSAFTLFLLGNIAIFAPGCHRLLTSLLKRMGMHKMAAKADLISSAFQIMGRHPMLLLGSLLISFFNQLLVIAATWIMALGLSLNVPPYYFLIFVPVITLISMIPVSLNGMGLRELAFKSLFGSVGVPPASCIALGLLSSIVLILSSLPGGVIYIFFRNRNEREQLAAFETEF